MLGAKKELGGIMAGSEFARFDQGNELPGEKNISELVNRAVLYTYWVRKQK